MYHRCIRFELQRLTAMRNALGLEIDGYIYIEAFEGI